MYTLTITRKDGRIRVIHPSSSFNWDEKKNRPVKPLQQAMFELVEALESTTTHVCFDIKELDENSNKIKVSSKHEVKGIRNWKGYYFDDEKGQTHFVGEN